MITVMTLMAMMFVTLHDHDNCDDLDGYDVYVTLHDHDNCDGLDDRSCKSNDCLEGSDVCDVCGWQLFCMFVISMLVMITERSVVVS